MSSGVDNCIHAKTTGSSAPFVRISYTCGTAVGLRGDICSRVDCIAAKALVIVLQTDIGVWTLAVGVMSSTVVDAQFDRHTIIVGIGLEFQGIAVKIGVTAKVRVAFVRRNVALCPNRKNNACNSPQDECDGSHDGLTDSAIEKVIGSESF